MPVTGSSFAFSWPIVHDGVIRRSEDEFSEVIWRGMSPAVCMLLFVGSQSEFEFKVQDVREEVGCKSSRGFGFGGMTQFQVSPGLLEDGKFPSNKTEEFFDAQVSKG